MDPALRDWVKCFWSIVDGPSEEIQEVWPDGCIELVFTNGNTFRVNADGSSERFAQAVVIGLQTGVMRVRSDGEVRLIGARMFPFARIVWQTSQLELLALQIEPLLRAGFLPEAVRIMEAWLLQQPRIEDAVSAALRDIFARGGNVEVRELADALRVSTRQLERKFAAQLGIAPKTFARVMRFAQGWSMMLGRPDLTLAELALELGYSDQAHFSNEFRRFSKQSPQGFRKKWRSS